MTEKIIHMDAPAGCLSLNTIYDYIQGQLTEEESHGVERHLIGCAMCAEAVIQATVMPQSEAGAITASIMSKVEKRVATSSSSKGRVLPIWTRIASVAAGLALLLSIALWMSRENEVVELAEIKPKSEVKKVEEKTKAEEPATESAEGNSNVVAENGSKASAKDKNTAEPEKKSLASDRTEMQASTRKESALTSGKSTNTAITNSADDFADNETLEPTILRFDEVATIAVPTTKNLAPQQLVSSDPAAGLEDITAPTLLALVTVDSRVVEEREAVELSSTARSKTRMKVASADRVEMPSAAADVTYPGGEDALTNYISGKLVYPNGRLLGSNEGKMKVAFTANSDGHVSNVKILQGFDTAVDALVLNTISNLPASVVGSAANSGKTDYVLAIKLRYAYAETPQLSKDKKKIEPAKGQPSY